MKLPETNDYTFSDWINSTAELQREAYGCDPADLTGDEMADFVRWNVLAAEDELHEMLNEIGWKPWATSRHVRREAALGELVDCLHFVGNLLRLLHVDGEELTAAYRSKQRRNHERQVEGYDGVAGKCRGCKRDLLEVGIESVMRMDSAEPVSQFCAGCGAEVISAGANRNTVVDC